jgi:CDP-glucose 4,6-dehydratase
MENSLESLLSNTSGPILLTGHTGFKGTWMTLLLEHLGLPVIGYSLPAERYSLYSRTNRLGTIPEEFNDIRDQDALNKFINFYKPSIIVHMAAQPLVLKSYEFPRETFEINIMGTTNLLDIAFKSTFVQVVVVLTTDKVYDNKNLGKRFTETDALLGKDPYSASKVGAESVIAGYQKLIEIYGGPKIAAVRAGNVIGGGDFASDRLIPDMIRSYISGETLIVRNKNSTRPWQHVLDPLNGYLSLINALMDGKSIKHINFGPVEKSLSVSEVINISSKIIDINYRDIDESQALVNSESHKLELDSNYAKDSLNWYPKFDQKSSIEHTLNWWINVLRNGEDPFIACKNDIDKYLNMN